MQLLRKRWEEIRKRVKQEIAKRGVVSRINLLNMLDIEGVSLNPRQLSSLVRSIPNIRSIRISTRKSNEWMIFYADEEYIREFLKGREGR